MKQICFLSCESLEGFIVDDELVIHELEKDNEYSITTIPWDNDAKWSSFDLVIIRTTWDYAWRHVEFLNKLNLIASQTNLSNSSEVIAWNIHKGYLNELGKQGVKLVPTQMFTYPGSIQFPKEWNYQKMIVKPAISAGSFKTMIVSREDLTKDTFLNELMPGDWMLQPFLEEIKQGELSLHYFNKKFSHAIKKTPKQGDFRVQEEFGGIIQPYSPDDRLLSIAQNLVNLIPFDLLYARVDMLPLEGEYVLMELELIEPALYFSTNSEAAKNFKVAIDHLIQSYSS